MNLRDVQIYELAAKKGWSTLKIAKSLRINRGQVYLAKHRVSKLLKKEIAQLAQAELLSMVGTVGYVAPEGAGRPPADIFSLGRVLHDCAFGISEQSDLGLPDNFEAMGDQDDLLELNEVILKACQHKLNLRYASAGELIRDLEVLQAGRSIRRMRLTERRSAGARRVAAAFMVLAAITAFALFQARRLPPRSQTASDRWRLCPTVSPL
jgi:serine/threonine protein kinase